MEPAAPFAWRAGNAVLALSAAGDNQSAMTSSSDPTPLVPPEPPTVVSRAASEVDPLESIAPVESVESVAMPLPTEPAWPAWQRFLFRYAAIHWLLYSFPGPLDHFLSTLSRGLQALAKTWPQLGIDVKAQPWRWPGKWVQELTKIDHDSIRIGGRLEDGHGFWQHVTTWLADNKLVPEGWNVIHQQTGSGDTAHDWLRVGVIVVASLLLAGLWTGLSRARHYPVLGRWLHLLVRFGLGFAMLSYGLAKFCGGQFGELSLFRLLQDIGDTTPMGMVGTFQQASRPYELFGGGFEVLGGLLLFHRRTALLGACVAIATMTNVCALNWLCGVPVKQYSAHLLLFAIALLAPFCARLWALFVSNRPSAPVDLAVTRSRWLAWLLTLVGVVWVGSSLYFSIVDRTRNHARNMQGREKSPLYGCWLVERMAIGGADVPIADAARWRSLAIDRGQLAWAEEGTGKRVFFDFALDATSTSASVKRRGAAGSEPVVWACELGTRIVPVDVPLLERPADRQRKVDGERRTLVLRGVLDGKPFELQTVEKHFRLQTGFRLRQELPEGW